MTRTVDLDRLAAPRTADALDRLEGGILHHPADVLQGGGARGSEAI
jgi:hypothetical protein